MSRMSANSPSVRLKLATTKRLRKKLTHVQICDLIIFNPFYAEVEGRIWPSRPERAFFSPSRQSFPWGSDNISPFPEDAQFCHRNLKEGLAYSSLLKLLCDLGGPLGLQFASLQYYCFFVLLSVLGLSDILQTFQPVHIQFPRCKLFCMRSLDAYLLSHPGIRPWRHTIKIPG